MRSLGTLKLRMKAAEEGARNVADFLVGHPAVASFWYLDFLPEDHPDRRVFERQCKSAGSTFSFEVCRHSLRLQELEFRDDLHCLAKSDISTTQSPWLQELPQDLNNLRDDLHGPSSSTVSTIGS